MKNKIIFNLKKEWYDKIKSGEKTIEYRSISDHWIRRLCRETYDDKKQKVWEIRKFDTAEFRLGYTKKNALVRTVTKIDFGPCPYEGWNDTYFRIHFK